MDGSFPGAAMAIPSDFALWSLVLTAPLLIWTIMSDLRVMKIRNVTVALIAAAALVAGVITLPWPVLGWQLLQLPVVLVAGLALWSLRAGIGAGDVKFLAAAAPFVFLGDLRLMMVILAGALLAGFVAHRIAKHSPLRRLAPDWQSWVPSRYYPAGLSLAAALAIYLGLGISQGH